MFFIAYHSVNLIIFLVAIVFAWTTLSKLRNTSATYNARLLPFAYLSLSSWILWALQYIILFADPSTSLPRSFFQSTCLLLGVMQNALWASAVLSLHSKRFSRMSWTLALLITFSNVIALIAYQTTVLTSALFTQIDAVFASIIFTAFAVLSIKEGQPSKIAAAAFVIHGISQWIWRSLWFTPLANTHIAILLGFPLWRFALLFAWIRLISAILQRAQPSHEEAIRDIEHLELPNLLDPFGVMISSTVEDLAAEREAADRAIHGLHLARFRAETFGSVSYSPLKICALLAKQCDVFILIIVGR